MSLEQQGLLQVVSKTNWPFSLSPDERAPYILSAAMMGFFLAALLMPTILTTSDEELADLIAETVQRTLGTNRPVSANELQTDSRAFMQYLNSYKAVLEKQLQQELK